MSRAGRPTVTLYTKPGCHLCESVEQTLAVARLRRDFDLVTRNILDDPADFEKYQYAIPVVLIGAVEVARFRLDLSSFLAALDGADGS